MSLHLIATGGTFDKQYDPLTGALGFGDSIVPTFLRRARVTAPIGITALPPLDSLDMGDADRARIRDACLAVPEERIVIVHGTDTMHLTAAVLAQCAPLHNRTVVLTGAMVPAVFEGSDAFFNLGFALGVANVLPAGVWIAMNGQAFPWDAARKNREAGVFEAA